MDMSRESIDKIMVPYYTVHLINTPPLFGTQGRLILDIAIATYSIYQFQDLFSLFYSTGEPTDWDNPGGVSTTPNGLYHQKRLSRAPSPIC